MTFDVAADERLLYTASVAPSYPGATTDLQDLMPVLLSYASGSLDAIAGVASWTAPASEAPGLTYLQGAILFVGVPIIVLLLIAVPIYAPVWWRRLRRRDTAGPDRTAAQQDVPEQNEPEQDDPDQEDRDRDIEHDAKQKPPS